MSIAVVIPTYNRAALLPRAIESVLDQERTPEKIVVVDDGSTDETDVALKRFGSALTVVRTDNRGASAARNEGVHHAETDFVAFLDSDDIWYRDHLRRIDDAITATAGVAAVYFDDIVLPKHYFPNVALEESEATVWGAAEFTPKAPFELRRDARDWTMLAFQPMMIPSSVIRVDAYLAVGGSNPDWIRRGDTHLFFNLGLTSPLCAVCGLAGEVTVDDPNSLIRRHSLDDTTFWECTVAMYSDVLQSHADLRPDHRALLMSRLAYGYWGLARVMRSQSRTRALLAYVAAIRRRPRIGVEKLRNRLDSSTSVERLRTRAIAPDRTADSVRSVDAERAAPTLAGERQLECNEASRERKHGSHCKNHQRRG